jgi:drug/metabolite transporter (DMT)-like permease
MRFWAGLTGFQLIVAGNTLYLLSDIILKFSFAGMDSYQISFFRFAPGILLLAFCSIQNVLNWKSIFFAVVNVINSIFGVFALKNGSLAGYTLAGQMKPLIFSALAILILHERTKPATIGYLILGTVISGYLVASQGDIFDFYTTVFIISTAVQCLSFVALGKDSSSKDVVGGLALYNLTGAAISLGLFTHTHGTPSDIVLGYDLLSYGAPALIGSILLALSYRKADVGRSNIANFIRLPLGIAASILIFGEAISWQVILLAGALTLITKRMA